jgi:hypothetical protein
MSQSVIGSGSALEVMKFAEEIMPVPLGGSWVARSALRSDKSSKERRLDNNKSSDAGEPVSWFIKLCLFARGRVTLP